MWASVAGLHAQENREPKRTSLIKNDLSTVPDHEGIMGRVEMAPGVQEAKHTHPGELFGYVQAGTLTLHVEGKPAANLDAGQAFFVPANTVHWGENKGQMPCAVIATMVVPKGKPVTSTAK